MLSVQGQRLDPAPLSRFACSSAELIAHSVATGESLARRIELMARVRGNSALPDALELEATVRLWCACVFSTAIMCAPPRQCRACRFFVTLSQYQSSTITVR